MLRHLRPVRNAIIDSLRGAESVETENKGFNPLLEKYRRRVPVSTMPSVRCSNKVHGRRGDATN